MSIPLLRATPILVLCAPKSIPTTLIVVESSEGCEGRWWKDGGSREKRSEKSEGRICTPLHYYWRGDGQVVKRSVKKVKNKKSMGYFRGIK
jgi:hypothetical protein